MEHCKLYIRCLGKRIFQSIIVDLEASISMRSYPSMLILLVLIQALSLVLPSSVRSQATAGPKATDKLERSFQVFLQKYWQEIKRRNGTYLKSVHPKLPNEMHGFFFDSTLQMMQYSEQKGLKRTLECQEFNVCKIVYPQPNDSWAAQRFILHEGAWRWLDQ